MNKKSILLFILLVATGSVFGQSTYFGKNKVQYEQFDWQYIQTRYFDIYFYDVHYETAKFSATVLESAYVVISKELNYQVRKRIPVFLYASHNDFLQTNIISGMIGEGTGGFTESAKNRIAIPFSGSLEDLRHVLHHELTHAVVYDMLIGNLFTSLLSRRRLFMLPLWYAEGYAEYSSRDHWHYRADMIVRDATINNYLYSPELVAGGLEYYQGPAMINYIADNYGKQKLGEILAKGKIHITMNKALESSIGISMSEFWEDFSIEMKRRYWPEISKRSKAGEIANALTDHTKDASNRNEKPIFSPKGNHLAIFSDRSDYTEIYLISAVDGSIIQRLVKGHRTGDLESLHSYLSGIAFSPDGEKIAFVSKTKGKDALYFITIKDREIYKRKRYDFGSIFSPVWSPDGTKIAFTALNDRFRDIFVYDIEHDSTYNLNLDLYDDMDPHWYPDSKRLVFSSDRPHPDNDFILNNFDEVVNDSLNWSAIYYNREYGNYNLFTIDIETEEIVPVACGPGQNREPVVSPDGRKICFVSNRNGIDNLYLTDVDSPRTFAITDILTNAESPSWSPDGKQIAFSSFNNRGQDIYLLKDIKPAGDNGVLEPTGFVKGEYLNNWKKEAPGDSSFTKIDSDFAALRLVDSTEVGYSFVNDGDKNSADENTLPPITDTDEADSTRIENGEYIFVSKDDSTRDGDAVDGLFSDVTDSSLTGNMLTPEEMAVFDSVAQNSLLPNGEFRVHNYRVKFTPDFVSGGFSYDTFFGLRGQSVFAFSDYTGDHQIFLITDLVNTIDQSNLQLYYFYNRMRLNFGIGAFHTKNYYIDSYDHLFSDRLYGLQSSFSLPFSKFFRAELLVSQIFIDRRFHDGNDPRTDRSTKATVASFSLVQDNILWGITGPLNGRRSRLDFSGATDLFGGNSVSFYAAEFDYRKYWHLKGLFSTAIRFSGGASWGKQPKRFFLGGTSNFIGNTVIDAEVYEEDNLYFASVITPLRGFDYYEFYGTRYFLTNFEFRYPFIDYLQTNFPIPMTIRYVTGSLFFDLGAAWENDETFKGGSSFGDPHLQDIHAGFGFGIRANLGIFVLRYDLAWKTDLATVSHHPKYTFSLGADF